MHLTLCNTFITLFLVYEACKTPHLYRSIDLHDQQSHRLKYYGELSSQRLLQDGMNAGRKETKQSSAKKRGQYERHGEIATGKDSFQKAMDEQKAMGARMRCFYLRLQ